MSSFRFLAGQTLFFIVVSSWAAWKRGRVHFFSELVMFGMAALAFGINDATRLEYPLPFAVLSLSLWLHMVLIVREIVLKGDAE